MQSGRQGAEEGKNNGARVLEQTGIEQNEEKRNGKINQFAADAVQPRCRGAKEYCNAEKFFAAQTATGEFMQNDGQSGVEKEGKQKYCRGKEYFLP